jgi:hemerythrin-like domain-containing protein
MLRDPSLVPLSRQHHDGLALCVLTRRALGKDRSDSNVARLARRAIDHYELELVNHFELEEQMLFAEAERHLGKLDLVAALVAEHRRIEQMIAEMRVQPSAEALERFCDLLSSHIRREESEFFQHVQQTLPREMLDRIGKVLQEKAVRVCL